MAFQIKSQVGLAAKLAAHKSASTVAEGQELQAPAPKAQPITYLAVNDPAIKDRIGIVFDDSVSMSGSKLREAKDGVIEFLKSCIPNQTAVALYPMGGSKFKLETNLIYLAGKVLEIELSGSTPLVVTANRLLSENTTLTRGVVFSDGQPNNPYTESLVATCKERKVPLDTVYISGSYVNEVAVAFMRKLAEDTGGTFIHLKPGVSMRNTFKYLAPCYRALLTDKSFVENLQNGKV